MNLVPLYNKCTPEIGTCTLGVHVPMVGKPCPRDYLSAFWIELKASLKVRAVHTPNLPAIPTTFGVKDHLPTGVRFISHFSVRGDNILSRKYNNEMTIRTCTRSMGAMLL